MLFSYRDVGGYNGIVSGLPEDMLKLELHAENIWLFLSLIFYSLLPDKNSGTFVQRFLISKNSKQLVKCMKIIAFLYLPFTLIICLIGLIIKVKAPNIDHNEALIYFISNYVSVGIKGLLIAGLLAVIMSTADSWLNTTSVLFAYDIIGNIIHLTEKQALFIARAFTFLLCILAIELIRRDRGIMEVSWLVDNLWGPLISVPLIAGFLSRTNSKSFIAAVMVAIYLPLDILLEI